MRLISLNYKGWKLVSGVFIPTGKQQGIHLFMSKNAQNPRKNNVSLFALD